MNSFAFRQSSVCDDIVPEPGTGEIAVRYGDSRTDGVLAFSGEWHLLERGSGIPDRN